MDDNFARYPSLHGRAVLVSGGASGIGASIVAHFVAQGSHVGFLDLDEAAAHTLLGALERGPGKAHFRRVDLRDIAALRAGIAALRAEIALPFTVLVNNAARDDRHTIDEVTPEYWDERMATNIRHQFFAAQAVKDDMIAAGGGSIVNMSSNSFLLATGGMPAYTAAKSAVIGLTRGLARDLGPQHIRANVVYPGWIMTQRQLDLWVTPEAEERRRTGQCIPERLYEADVARMVLWLAADEAENTRPARKARCSRRGMTFRSGVPRPRPSAAAMVSLSRPLQFGYVPSDESGAANLSSCRAIVRRRPAQPRCCPSHGVAPGRPVGRMPRYRRRRRWRAGRACIAGLGSRSAAGG